MFLTIIIAVKGQQKMYHGLWSHYCMFPVFKLITVMFIQKFFSPFLLLWGSRTERSVKTSFPSFFFFFCWIYVGDVNVFVCLCHEFLLPALMYWQIYQMPVIFFTQCFMDLFIVMLSKKKILWILTLLYRYKKLKLRHYNLWKVWFLFCVFWL